MFQKAKYNLILQLIVLIWGFTGILGDHINMDSARITLYRTAIALLVILPVLLIYKSNKLPDKKQIFRLLGVGIIVGLHWFAFFYAIKVSNVSIAVVCMASSALFTSILEPLFFKRKIFVSELILSVVTIVGIIAIFGFEYHYYLGIIYGLICALLSAVFTVLNGQLIKETSPLHITLYEMLGATLTMAIIIAIMGGYHTDMLVGSFMDWGFLLILGIVCTVGAFMASVWIMNYVTPFTVSISLNMEPIYTIIIALIIDYALGTSKEQMSVGFYIGASIIIVAIFTNAYLKNREQKKLITG